MNLGAIQQTRSAGFGLINIGIRLHRIATIIQKAFDLEVDLRAVIAAGGDADRRVNPILITSHRVCSTRPSSRPSIRAIVRPIPGQRATRRAWIAGAAPPSNSVEER